MSRTTSGNRTVRPATSDDWERVASLRRWAFDWPGDASILEDMWVLEEAGTIVACARLERDAQWLGGRAVPTGLVSSVAVAPPSRGRGVGSHLLRALMGHARESGLPRLALYPSALRPYRRAGFEIAGTAVEHTVHAEQLKAASGPAIDELRPGDEQGVAACYDRVASGCNGAIGRSRRWWETRVFAASTPAPHAPAAVHGFVVRDQAQVTGYALYTQAPDGNEAYATRISCRDLVWETEDAARALLGLLGSGAPMTTSVSWLGEAVDAAWFLLDAPARVTSVEPWMARLADPVAAIAEHRTAPDANADVALTILDPFEAAWSVDVVIRIRDGRATAEPAARGEADADATIDTGALAAMLTGGLSPEVAAATGRLVPGRAGLAPLRALAPPGRAWIGDRF